MRRRQGRGLLGKLPCRDRSCSFLEGVLGGHVFLHVDHDAGGLTRRKRSGNEALHEQQQQQQQRQY
jgi:hypothetical protein